MRRWCRGGVKFSGNRTSYYSQATELNITVRGTISHMKDSQGRGRELLTNGLTIAALSVGAFVGVGLNIYSTVAGVFSPQARVASQNDRISGAIGFLGNTA